MPRKGWRKYHLYEYEGRKIQNPDQAIEAVRYLRRMGHKHFKVLPTKNGYKVYHGWE